MEGGFFPPFFITFLKVIDMQTTKEQDIEDLVSTEVRELGFNIVRLRIVSAASKIIEVLIERLDEAGVTITDCKLVSKTISNIIEEVSELAEKYALEVSSCGIERPLVKPEDYNRFVGKEIMVKLHKAHDNKKKYQGLLRGMIDDKVQIACNGQDIEFEYTNIKDAHLVLTDELFRQLLNNK